MAGVDVLAVRTAKSSVITRRSMWGRTIASPLRGRAVPYGRVYALPFDPNAFEPMMTEWLQRAIAATWPNSPEDTGGWDFGV
jgi:hypothetical protein